MHYAIATICFAGAVLPSLVAPPQKTTKQTEVGVNLKGVTVRRTTTTTAPRTSAPIKVIVDGTPVAFSDQGPMVSSGRVLVPLRGVFEAMGASVDWDPDSRHVMAAKGENRTELWAGKVIAKVNGNNMSLDEPARLVNGRIMVPLRFVSEALGATVNWKADARTVSIETG